MESQETTEEFRDRMRRLMSEADERYEKMSPEDQQLLDEAARRHHEKVRLEITASHAADIRKRRTESIERLPTDNNS